MAGRELHRQKDAQSGAHHWRFYRSGGVDQVIIKDGADLANLRNLDLKLWMALAMPIAGIDFDRRTAELIDVDRDGRIRPKEVVEAAEWICAALVDPGLILEPGDSVPLEAIRDPTLRNSAQLLLQNLGKAGARAVSMEDVANRERVFADTLFNGDGVVPPEAAEDEETRRAMADIMAASGAVQDRSGKPGLDRDRLSVFFAEAEAFAAWAERPSREAGLAPLGTEKSAVAQAAVTAVRAKVEDFFTRCRLAAFDPRAAAALNRNEEDFRSIAGKELSGASSEIAAFPLAVVAPGAPLPLRGAVNPAWAAALEALADCAVRPLLGERVSLDEAAWRELLAALAPYEAWLSERPESRAGSLGQGRIAELLAGGYRERLAALIERDAALEDESARIESVERLVRYRRDLHRLLRNYINFADFYGRRGSVFQSGTLYLDARACSLCIDVTNEGKHAALAALSGMCLLYCELSRPGEARRTIVAAVTDGDADNLMVGRNGVFFDREGRDWDATITRIVANPISVRQAFWLPYKKLVRMIEEMVAKRAQAGEASSDARLAATASAVTGASGAPPVPKPEAKKFDLGTIALIGTAIGGISAMVAGFLQTLFGLGAWLPLGILGLVLLISGPSMILASLKLRRRNLGPLLDANGWAINTQARINIPFGVALTDTAALPPGSLPSLADPFAEKRKPWLLYVLLGLAVVAAAFLLWRFGVLDGILPEALRRSGIRA